MKAQESCLPCIEDDLRGAVRSLDLPPGVREKIIREVQAYLKDNFDTSRPPSFWITEAHRILKRLSGISFPFAEVRRQANRVGIQLAMKIREEVKGLKDRERFRCLVRYAVAGNEMDFRTIGAGYGMGGDEMEKRLREAAKRPLAVDDIERIYSATEKAEKVLFIHDNVGEIALDRLLGEEITSRGKKVVSALRGGPITSDAVMEDGKEVGLDEVAELIEAGPDTLGISFEEMSASLSQALAEADLVISKGQANYYVLSDQREKIPGPIAYLLRTKCDLVAAQFGKQGKVSIAALR